MRLGDHPQSTVYNAYRVPDPVFSTLYVYLIYNVNYVKEQVRTSIGEKIPSLEKSKDIESKAGRNVA